MRHRWKVFGSLVLLLILVGCSLVGEGDGGPAAAETPRDDTTVGTLIVTAETEPDDRIGTFQFTGVPSGTVSTGGTLVVTGLEPGTYTTTQVDPAPEFDLVAVRCDDGDSSTSSAGDPQTRSAIFNIDPGEMVQCTFTNARRGTVIVSAEVDTDTDRGSFQYTGVPSGTVPAGGELVVADLPPGTYTTTEVDPAPDFELTEVVCDDGGSATSGGGDPTTRSAIYNLDPGETVRCVFRHEVAGETSAGGPGSGSGGSPTGGTNPFDDPDRDLADFPLPEDLPADAGSSVVPKAGPWTVENLAGAMDCGGVSLAMPAGPPETGVIEVLDGGQTLIGSSLQEDQTAPITMSADPDVLGRYTGAIGGTELGVPITINYIWQVVTDEYIVGYLTSSFTAEGATCAIYRPYVLTYAGEE